MRFASLALPAFVLACLTLALPPALADDKPVVNPALTDKNYKNMAVELTLTADQQASLVDILAKKKAAIDDWDTTNQAQVTALREKSKSDNAEDAKQAKHDLNVLLAAKRTLATGFEAQIDALLTPEQAQKWQTIKLAREADSRYKAANLTEDQKTQIHTLADTTATAILAANGDGKAIDGLKKKFYADIHDTVLTDAQREVMNTRTHKTHGGPTTAPAVPATPPPAPAN